MRGTAEPCSSLCGLRITWVSERNAECRPHPRLTESVSTLTRFQVVPVHFEIRATCIQMSVITGLMGILGVGLVLLLSSRLLDSGEPSPVMQILVKCLASSMEFELYEGRDCGFLFQLCIPRDFPCVLSIRHSIDAC